MTKKVKLEIVIAMAIINRDTTYGTLNGVITKNTELMSLVFKHIKKGTAKKLIDTDNTLMYEIKIYDNEKI